MDNINDIECREPREVESFQMQRGTVVPSVAPVDYRELKLILLSFGVGAVVVIMGVVIYIAVE